MSLKILNLSYSTDVSMCDTWTLLWHAATDTYNSMIIYVNISELVHSPKCSLYVYLNINLK